MKTVRKGYRWQPSTYRWTLAGSTFADRTAKSLKLVGNTPVHEAAERYPADAFRVFVRKHHLSFTDESPVCNASLFKHKLHGV